MYIWHVLWVVVSARLEARQVHRIAGTEAADMHELSSTHRSITQTDQRSLPLTRKVPRQDTLTRLPGHGDVYTGRSVPLLLLAMRQMPDIAQSGNMGAVYMDRGIAACARRAPSHGQAYSS